MLVRSSRRKTTARDRLSTAGAMASALLPLSVHIAHTTAGVRRPVKNPFAAKEDSRSERTKDKKTLITEERERKRG